MSRFKRLGNENEPLLRRDPASGKTTGLSSHGKIVLGFSIVALLLLGFGLAGTILGGTALNHLNNGIIGTIADLTVGSFHATGHATVDGGLTVTGGIVGKSTKNANGKRDDMVITVAGASLFSGEIVGEQGVTIGQAPTARVPPSFDVVKLTVFGSANVYGDTITTNLNVSGIVDFSRAQIKTAPKAIVIGNPTPGITSWPTTLVSRNKARKSVARNGRQRNILPNFPGFLPSGPYPPAGAIKVNTFREAILLLQGKVVNDTTIYVHPGTYTENVHLDGYFGRCSFASTDLNEGTTSSGQSSCRGLVVVGDNRAVAGVSYMHGGNAPAWFRTDLLGNWGGVTSLSCNGTRTLQVTVDGANPDFIGLGIVAGDKLVAYKASTDTYYDLVVQSAINTNQLLITTDSWSGSCPFDGSKGSLLTFLPNRVIQGRGYPAACGDAWQNHGDLVMPVSVLDTGNVGLIYGFHVKAPPTNECTLTLITSNDQGSAQMTGIVGDDRTVSTYYHATFIFVANQMQFSPYSGSVTQEPYNYGPIAASVLTSLGGATTYIESLGSVTAGSWNFIGRIQQSFGAGTQYFLGLNIHAPPGQKCAYVVDDGSIRSEIMFISGGDEASICLAGTASFSEVYGATTINNENSGAACVRVIDHAVFQLADAGWGHSFSECDIGFFVNQSASLQISDTGAGLGSTSNVGTFLSMSDSASVTYGSVVQRPAMANGASGAIRPDYRYQYLDGTSALHMTIAAPLTDYLNKEYSILSRSAYAHTIVLSGGATWDGTHTTATFPAAARSGLKFDVVSPTMIIVNDNIGSVTFS